MFIHFPACHIERPEGNHGWRTEIRRLSLVLMLPQWLASQRGFRVMSGMLYVFPPSTAQFRESQRRAGFGHYVIQIRSIFLMGLECVVCSARICSDRISASRRLQTTFTQRSWGSFLRKTVGWMLWERSGAWGVPLKRVHLRGDQNVDRLLIIFTKIWAWIKLGYPNTYMVTGVGKCPNWTSPYYWGYNIQQIFEGDVQSRKRDIYQPLWLRILKLDENLWSPGSSILNDSHGDVSWEEFVGQTQPALATSVNDVRSQKISQGCMGLNRKTSRTPSLTQKELGNATRLVPGSATTSEASSNWSLICCIFVSSHRWLGRSWWYPWLIGWMW